MMTVVRMYSYNHKLNPTHYSNVAITVNTYSLLSSKDKEYKREKTNKTEAKSPLFDETK